MTFINKLYEMYIYIITYILYMILRISGFNTGKCDMPDDDDIFDSINFGREPGSN